MNHPRDMRTAPKRRANNRSGRVGVHWHQRAKRWRARVQVAGERFELGEFVEFPAAVAAREEAERRFGLGAGL